jgi:hypothetical protein
MSQAGKTRIDNEILALHKRAEASEASQVHWSTYVWGTTTILFGLRTVWNQTATYILNKEKLTAELESSMAVTISEVNRLIKAKLGPIKDDIRYLQEVAIKDE